MQGAPEPVLDADGNPIEVEEGGGEEASAQPAGDKMNHISAGWVFFT